MGANSAVVNLHNYTQRGNSMEHASPKPTVKAWAQGEGEEEEVEEEAEA